MEKKLTIKDMFAKLIDVKTIVTFSSLAVFVYLSVIQAIDADKFLAVFTTIIGFYFGTQSGKNNKL